MPSNTILKLLPYYFIKTQKTEQVGKAPLATISTVPEKFNNNSFECNHRKKVWKQTHCFNSRTSIYMFDAKYKPNLFGLSLVLLVLLFCYLLQPTIMYQTNSILFSLTNEYELCHVPWSYTIVIYTIVSYTIQIILAVVLTVWMGFTTGKNFNRFDLGSDVGRYWRSIK